MSKKLNRRSFLRRVGATASVGALGIVTGTSVARAQVTDSDGGPNADPVRRGRGTRRGARPSCTDNDYMSNPGSGAHDEAFSCGVTDSDGGPNADRGGRGRGGNRSSRSGATGLTDSDGGAMVDPGGNGRGGPRSSRTGMTDADSAPTADRGGYGRGNDH